MSSISKVCKARAHMYAEDQLRAGNPHYTGKTAPASSSGLSAWQRREAVRREPPVADLLRQVVLDDPGQRYTRAENERLSGMFSRPFDDTTKD